MIGILLLVCVVFYVIPRTAVLGAILLTGFSEVRLLRAYRLNIHSGMTCFRWRSRG